MLEQFRRADSISKIQQVKKNQDRHSMTFSTPPHILIDMQTIDRAKDELEFATNWRRGFTEIYTRLTWLNAYAIINNRALFKYEFSL